jgi:hypothetical protein
MINEVVHILINIIHRQFEEYCVDGKSNNWKGLIGNAGI